MQKKSVWKVTLLIVAVVVSIIGGPFAINEAYKAGNGYVTMWGADDVLNYYGAILGATATVVALAFTILFTKNQIQRDAYLKNETEKWRLIESTIGNILNEINPMPILKQEIDSGFADHDTALKLLQKYQISCRIATDQLMTCVNNVDFAKIAGLVKQIQDIAEKLCQLSQKKTDQYNKLRQLQQRENTMKLLAIEQQHPGSLPTSEVTNYQETIRTTEDICMEEIADVMKEINKKFLNMYDTEFRPLMQLKGMTFESINIQIQKNADAMLSLRRR